MGIDGNLYRPRVESIKEQAKILKLDILRAKEDINISIQFKEQCISRITYLENKLQSLETKISNPDEKPNTFLKIISSLEKSNILSEISWLKNSLEQAIRMNNYHQKRYKHLRIALSNLCI